MGSISWEQIVNVTQVTGQAAFIENEMPHKLYDTSVIKFGSVFEVTSGSTQIDIWLNGGIYTGQPISELEPVTIVLTSPDDTMGGIGAQKIILSYLGSFNINCRGFSEEAFDRLIYSRKSRFQVRFTI